MGNCQAIDTASLIIQHPNGKNDRLYWPVNASEVMKMNPGHYIALFISTTIITSRLNHGHNHRNNPDPVRLTRIKLLKPTDSLILGQVYRLVTTQEVMQGLKAKKEAKLKKYQLDNVVQTHPQGKADPETTQPRRSDQTENNHHHQVIKHERNNRPRKSTSTPNKSRSWQPSLQSISEVGS